ncbi:MAG: putative lipid II flippase FtsW [candidate division Zixibacteria bacterium HGW-Zixibacteria-1]|nr:MAG: putative lipid II flippase FtsW [candidate division Zixibacteria bacterium HGW-Zixibacteria-1]
MDKKLLYSTVALIAFGMVMVYSSSSVMAENRFGTHYFFLQRQFIWLIIAAVAGWLVTRVDLKKYAAYSVPLIFISLAMLVLVFIMPARNGSHRWLFIGPLTIQPSEIFKLVVVAYLAFSLSQKKRDITDFKQFMIPYAPLIGAGLVLIILEPGLGSALTISATVLMIFFLAGVRLYHLAVLITPFVGLIGFMVFVLGYKKPRVIDYMSAVGDPLSGSYQVKQAVLALGAGGIFGSGLGNGRQKLFFLPYPHTDFIFASIGEEVGFIGLMAVLLLFFIIIRQGIKIAKYQPDRFGYLLAMGITASIFTAVVINIGVVTSLLPTTGIPLPFLSYGGSALLMSIVSVAVLLNLSRRKGVLVR